jgi:hypothetical protein
VESDVVADFAAPSLYPRDEIVWYPYWPRVLPESMDQDHPLTRAFPPMPLFWPAPISVDRPKHEEAGRTVTILATTSDKGYRRGHVDGLKEADEAPSGKMLEKVPLIVLVEGPMASFWAGKPAPGEEKAPDEGGTGEGEAAGDEAPGNGKAAEGDGSESGAPEDAGEGAAPGEDGGDDAGKQPPEDVGDPDGPGGDAAPPDGDDGDEDNGDGDGDGDADAEDPPEGPGEGGDEPPAKGDEPASPPEGPGGDAQAPPAEGGDAEEAPPAGPARLEQGDVHLLVIGDAELISDYFSPRTPLGMRNGAAGFDFVGGAASWFGGSDELLALRARAANPRQLDKIEDGTRSLLKWLNLALVPLLVLLAGITVFIVRRS